MDLVNQHACPALHRLTGVLLEKKFDGITFKLMHMLPILAANGICIGVISQFIHDCFSHFDPILGIEKFLDLTGGNVPPMHRILNARMPGSKKWWRMSSN